MRSLELRFVRGVLGLRAGRGRLLARAEFARLLRRTERHVFNYEHGRTPIPHSVAECARRLRDVALR